MAGWLVGVTALLGTCFLMASAQRVELDFPGSPMVGVSVDFALTCSLRDFDSTGLTLYYEWISPTSIMPTQINNQLIFFGTFRVGGAAEYECRVYESETAPTPLASNRTSLYATIRTFEMRFIRVEDGFLVPHVGQNVSYSCGTQFNGVLLGLLGQVQVFGPDGNAFEGSDGRVSITETMTVNRNFERTLSFSPLSAEDTGDYRCTGTIMPDISNPLITNGTGSMPLSINVQDTSISVSLSSPVMGGRFLDTAPYNSLQLNCTVGVTVVGMPVPSLVVFSWLSSVDGFLSTPLPAENFTNPTIFASSATSTLSVLTEETGNHTYFCEVRLDVAPATDNISRTQQVEIEVFGLSVPSSPLEVTALPLSLSSATIQWQVSAIQYTPELYTVLYGTSRDNLHLESTAVNSTQDITRTNFALSVTLEGLEGNTEYFYRVQANNSVNVTLGPLLSFITTPASTSPDTTTTTTTTTTSPTTPTSAETQPTDGGDFPLLPVIVGAVVGVLVIAILLVTICIVVMYCCRRKKSKEFSSPGLIDTKGQSDMELGKRKDYVNDTVLCDQQAPLYTPVTVKERLQTIPVSQFAFHVKEKHANRDAKFEEEYESLANKDDKNLPAHEIAKLNKTKNRFANIFPYDFSRVKLSLVEGQAGSDYVNASYIDGYKQANAYIAAQGPLPNTIGDFWRMIWEHKLNAVIMLTKVVEGGKKKCEQYWPTHVKEPAPQPNTTLQVTLKEYIQFADYEIRKLEVADMSEECKEAPLSITQYHFLGWPDHGVPKFATSLIEFIRRVRHSYRSERPILVHCGAGVGRTGTYITLDSMLERMKEADNINVYDFVRNMRAKRVMMVQTQEQYVFIHDALEELITCGETYISAPELQRVINSLNTVNPATTAHETHFEEQFKLLNKVSRIPTDSDLSDALQHYNERKNRYQDKVPYNNNRVRLRPTGAPGTEYINASFVDGYKHRNSYIATQGPLEGTVEEFWRMIWEFKSKVIVMLCQTEEDEKEMSFQYWPEKVGGAMCAGKLQVTLQSQMMEKGYVERKLEIKEPMADGTPGQGFVVTQFHYEQWAEHDRPPTSTGLLQLIKSLNNAQRNTGNKPVTVMCNDGVGRTGSFICIHAMMERVNTENILDFFQFIKSSRIHRPSLVIELEHYRFCHDALADYLNSLDSYANFKDLS